MTCCKKTNKRTEYHFLEFKILYNTSGTGNSCIYCRIMIYCPTLQFQRPFWMPISYVGKVLVLIDNFQSPRASNWTSKTNLLKLSVLRRGPIHCIQGNICFYFFIFALVVNGRIKIGRITMSQTIYLKTHLCLGVLKPGETVCKCRRRKLNRTKITLYIVLNFYNQALYYASVFQKRYTPLKLKNSYT